MKRILTIVILTLPIAHCPAIAEAINNSPALTAWRESLKDGEVLKACLYENLLIEDDLMYDGWSPWNLALEFKEQAGELPDERIRNALLDIYREAEAKPGRDARDIMMRTVLWLGACPDEVTKKFLLDVASTIKKDGFLRTTALASFLRIADAEETVDVLLRFLVESERMDSQARSTLLWSAFETFGDSSPTKREAIVDSLCVALANEDNKWLFRVYDDILCQISDQYANSTQRRDILLKLIKAPALCKADEIALPELEKKRRTLKKNRLSTTINTNLTTLKERNYTQPAVPSGYALSLGTAAHEETANVKLKKMLIPGGWRLTLLFFCGTLALSITILGLFIQKKRRVKATLKRWHEAK